MSKLSTISVINSLHKGLVNVGGLVPTGTVSSYDSEQGLTSLSFSFLIWHQFLHLASGHGNSCLSGMIAGVDEMVHLGLNAGPGIE